MKKSILVIACFCAVALPNLWATLTLTTSTNAVSMPFVASDYDASTGAAQTIKTAAQTLTIVSDKNTWTVSVRALSSSFSFTASSGDPNPNKPASSLAVRVPAFSASWIALTTSNQVLVTGPKSNSSQTKSIDYRLNSNLSTDPPGTYAISVMYTLTTP